MHYSNNIFVATNLGAKLMKIALKNIVVSYPLKSTLTL